MPARNAKKTSKKPAARSLAYLKFTKRHEAELRHYWYEQVMQQYGVRWLQANGNRIPGGISSFAGDSRRPFRSVDLAPATLIGLVPKHTQMLAHAAVVRLVTAFETFLYDSVQRAVFIDPSRFKKSELKIDASSIGSAIGSGGARAWFAHFVADKWCRGNSPADLIKKVDSLLQAGCSERQEQEIARWVRWTLVRNAIAHLGGDSTKELADAWSARFSGPGKPIVLTDADVMEVADVSRTLAAALDAGQIPLADRVADCQLLAAELFVRLGVDDPGRLASESSRILACGLSRGRAVQMLAQFRKEPVVDAGVLITDEMLE